MGEQLSEQMAVLNEALRASEEDIAKLQAKLREARARQNSLVTRMESAQNRLRAREMYAGEKVQDAFARFELLERRVDMAEGHADAMALAAQPPTLEQEIAALQTNDKVEAELAALKAAQAKKD
jgi:phage shock protein A